MPTMRSCWPSRYGVSTVSSVRQTIRLVGKPRPAPRPKPRCRKRRRTIRLTTSEAARAALDRRVPLTTLVVVGAVAAVVIAVAVAVAAVVIARAVALLRPFAVALVGFMPADHAADTGPEEAVVTGVVAGDAADRGAFEAAPCLRRCSSRAGHECQCKTRRDQERFHRRDFLCVVKRSVEKEVVGVERGATICIARPVDNKSQAVVTATGYIPNSHRLRRAEEQRR